MSADNGIYIAKFSDGYRVIHAQAIENIDYFPEGSVDKKEMIGAYFGGATPVETLEQAYVQADGMVKEILSDDFCPILEYGIVNLGELEDFIVPEDGADPFAKFFNESEEDDIPNE